MKAVLVTLILLTPSVGATVLDSGVQAIFSIGSAVVLAVSLFRKESRLRMLDSVRSTCFELTAFSIWFAFVAVSAVLGRGTNGQSHVLIQAMGATMIMVAMCVCPDRRQHAKVVAWFTLTLGIVNVAILPSLLRDFGVSRKIHGMSGGFGRNGAQGLTDLYGFLGYSIVLPVMISVALASRGWKRAVLLVACSCTLLAVLISTYAASFAVALGGVLLMALWPVLGSGRSLLAKLLSLVAIVGALTIVVETSDSLPQLSFATSKLARIGLGVSSEGLVEGEETGRGSLMELSLGTFLSSPAFGIGAYTGTDVPDYYGVGGHCSWADQLAEYGVSGFGWYGLFLALVVRRQMRSLRATDNLEAWSRLVSTGLYLIGGLMNPVLVSYIVSPLFYFFVLGGTQSRGIEQFACTSATASGKSQTVALVEQPTFLSRQYGIATAAARKSKGSR